HSRYYHTRSLHTTHRDPDLHCFPTRRYSDLEQIIDYDDEALNPTFWYVDDQGMDHEVWFLDAVTAANQWMITQTYGVRGVAMWADRKSARLNSSHVKISYAVFCLKKKNRDEV